MALTPAVGTGGSITLGSPHNNLLLQITMWRIRGQRQRWDVSNTQQSALLQGQFGGRPYKFDRFAEAVVEVHSWFDADVSDSGVFTFPMSEVADFTVVLLWPNGKQYFFSGRFEECDIVAEVERLQLWRFDIVANGKVTIL